MRKIYRDRPMTISALKSWCRRKQTAIIENRGLLSTVKNLTIYLCSAFEKYRLISAHLVKNDLPNAGLSATPQTEQEYLRFNFSDIIFAFRIINWGWV